MIAALNRLVDAVERHLGEELDFAAFARAAGTTEYHLRRMSSSLAGMPLSEYVRRRRMTVAAAAAVRGGDDLLGIAVRHGCGSAEAFGRAFRAVPGAGPGDVRRDGAHFAHNRSSDSGCPSKGASLWTPASSTAPRSCSSDTPPRYR